MSFDLIQFQDDLAQKMLSLRSFQRLFVGDSYSRSGMSQKGRRRTRKTARDHLVSLGFTDTQARHIVQDTQDYASLLYNAEPEQ